MNQLPSSLTSFPPTLLITAIDIVAVAFLLYQFFMIVQGRRAFHIMAGVAVLVGVYIAALAMGLNLLRTMLETVAPYSVFALIVIFQSDVRRLLARIGRRRWLFTGRPLASREFAEEIALAVRDLSQGEIGAIIVLERDIGLRTFVESGVRIDGALSQELLITIFQPTAALHDGAVIVQGETIAAAACFLPLSTNPRLMSTLGSRHRAGVGITEETDCLSIIVSEETGRLSIAAGGDIVQGLSPEQVQDRITEHFRHRHVKPVRPKSDEGARRKEAST